MIPKAGFGSFKEADDYYRIKAECRKRGMERRKLGVLNARIAELEAEIERISGVGSPYGRMHHAELMQTEAVEALEEERAKNAALKSKSKIWCRVAGRLYKMVEKTVMVGSNSGMFTLGELYEHEKQVDDTDEVVVWR